MTILWLHRTSRVKSMNIFLFLGRSSLWGSAQVAAEAKVAKRWKAHTKALMSTTPTCWQEAFGSTNHTLVIRNINFLLLYYEGIWTGNWEAIGFGPSPSELPLHLPLHLFLFGKHWPESRTRPLYVSARAVFGRASPSQGPQFAMTETM